MTKKIEMKKVAAFCCRISNPEICVSAGKKKPTKLLLGSFHTPTRRSNRKLSAFGVFKPSQKKRNGGGEKTGI